MSAVTNGGSPWVDRIRPFGMYIVDDIVLGLHEYIGKKNIKEAEDRTSDSQ
jgi:hypothetical protein